MLGSSQLAETTQSFNQRLCSQKNTRQQRRCRAKAVSVESPFKLTQTAQTGANASNQTRKIRPCLCVGPWLCCSGEAATFVLSLLWDAWYRRSEQRNAGGICESHVRVCACVCLRVRVHACVLCVLPLCGHSLRLMVLSVFCSCPCAPKPLFPSSSGPQSVSITSVITFYFSTSTTKLLCFHPGVLSSSAHDLTYFIFLFYDSNPFFPQSDSIYFLCSTLKQPQFFSPLDVSSFYFIGIHFSLSFSLAFSLSGPEKGRCVASEYFTEPEIEITTENTANILSKSHPRMQEANICSGAICSFVVDLGVETGKLSLKAVERNILQYRV